MKKCNKSLSHYDDGFEKIKQYHDAWDKVRYKKIYEIEQMVERVIKIFEKRVDAKFLVTEDYQELQLQFKRMRIKTMFYMSGDARNIIEAIHPKLKKLYKKKKCIRYLKYTGESDGSFTYGKIYQSKYFDGVTYTIIKDDNKRKVKKNCGFFKRVDNSKYRKSML